jgi:MFS transporter, DHA2 family, multidrug resistance protein
VSRKELTRLRVLIDIGDGRLSVEDATGLIGVGRRAAALLAECDPGARPGDRHDPDFGIALVGIAQSEAGAASGLFNMMRNLGGAIGTAAIETFFTRREQFHSAIITPQVSLVDPATRNRLADLQRYFMAHGYPDPAGAMHRAIIAVGQTIRAQATIMGYADSFALIGVVLLVAVLTVTMLRKGAAAGGAAH